MREDNLSNMINYNQQTKQKRSRLRSKHVERDIYPSSKMGLGIERYSNGTGFIIIPNDVERSDYIKFSYQAGEVILITPTGEIIKDVKIPKHVIHDLVYPQEAGERGSLVSWMNIPIINQVVVTGALFSPGEMYPYDEASKVRSYDYIENENSIDESWNVKDALAILDIYFSGEIDSETNSGFEVRARSSRRQSRIKASVDGVATLYGDETAHVFSEEMIKLQVGSQETENDTEISTLTIDRSGMVEYLDRYENSIVIDGEAGDMTIQMKNRVTLDADKEILIGMDANESAVLGDTLVDLLGQILDAIVAITVTFPGGTTGTPVNAPQFLAIKAQLDTIKSLLVKVE